MTCKHQELNGMGLVVDVGRAVSWKVPEVAREVVSGLLLEPVFRAFGAVYSAVCDAVNAESEQPALPLQGFLQEAERVCKFQALAKP